MIDRHALPPFETILSRLGVESRRGRSRCPIHAGKNPNTFSFHEEKGLFHCFSCQASGDKITLVMNAVGVGFADALAWLGLQRGASDAGIRPEAKQSRRRRLEQGLADWTRQFGRQLRNEYYCRNVLLIRDALESLEHDLDSLLGWELLAIVYRGRPFEILEEMLDDIDLARTDGERVTAYKRWRICAR